MGKKNSKNLIKYESDFLIIGGGVIGMNIAKILA